MTIPVLQAAKRLGVKSKWRLSNLEMQKIIYLAHMVHLGEHDEPLVFGYFEAWDYGPVHPDLYHFIKMFGAQPVTNSFGLFDYIDDLDKGSERKLLDQAAKSFPTGSGPLLINIAHWDQGAWAKSHIPGQRHIAITNGQIKEEYQARLRSQATRHT